MTDLSNTILAKSNQLNADDLIGRSLTIRITNVRGMAGDQPIAIDYDGDNGKPFLPCKSMRRVLVGGWGADGKSYIGKSMTLYRDPDVQFGGVKVGGIRISHMSDLEKPLNLMLTASQKSKKPYTVAILRTESPKPPKPPKVEVSTETALLVQRIKDAYFEATTVQELQSVQNAERENLIAIKTSNPTEFAELIAIYTKRKEEMDIPV